MQIDFSYFRGMKHYLVLLIMVPICFGTTAQTTKKLCVAFYNQENLFDTIDAPGKNDEEFLPAGKYNWTHERYKNKLTNMSRVIAAMNEEKGPDFLGMCEIENDVALHDLALQLNTKALNYKKYITNTFGLKGPTRGALIMPFFTSPKM